MIFKRRKKHNDTVFIRYRKRKRSSSSYSVLLLLIVLGVFFYIYLSPNIFQQLLEKDHKPSPQPIPILSEDQDNLKPQGSSHSKQKVRIKDIKNQKNFKNIKPTDIFSDKFPIRDGVNLDQERQFDEILRLMEAHHEEDEDIENQVRRYRLIERKIKAPLNQEPDIDSRELFIQRFLENARRGGYEVQLDKNFKVLSIKKIKPQPL